MTRRGRQAIVVVAILVVTIILLLSLSASPAPEEPTFAERVVLRAADLNSESWRDVPGVGPESGPMDRSPNETSRTRGGVYHDYVDVYIEIRVFNSSVDCRDEYQRAMKYYEDVETIGIGTNGFFEILSEKQLGICFIRGSVLVWLDVFDRHYFAYPDYQVDMRALFDDGYEIAKAQDTKILVTLST